jgi:tight adherence protein B
MFVPGIRDRLVRQQEKLLEKAEKKSDELYLRVDPRRVMRISLIASAVFGTLFGLVLKSFIAGCVVFCLGMAVPYCLSVLSQRRRRMELEKQLPGTLEKLAAAMRAGGNLQSALEQIAERTGGPFGQEVTHLLQETGLGLSMEDALRRMSQRVGSEDVGTVCTAIAITLQTGGNLSSMLESIAAAVQERRNLDGTVKSLTSQGKMQGVIIGALPVMLLGVFSLMDYQMLRPLFETAMGKLLLCAGVVLEMIGLFVIRKIVDIKY